MSNDSFNKVISIWAPKEAALYFNQVFPFDFSHSLYHKFGAATAPNSNSIPFGVDDNLTNKILASLLPEAKSPRKTYAIYAAHIMLMHFLFDAENRNEPIEKMMDIYGSSLEEACRICSLDSNVFMRAMRRRHPAEKTALRFIAPSVIDLMDEAGFSNAPQWIASDFDIGNGINPSQEDQTINAPRHFIATLSGLNLVNPNSVSWEQVLEFRNDRESKEALADLRLFFRENLTDKSVSYALDKLDTMVYKSEKAAKLWGFDLAQQSLSAIFSKSL